MKTFVQPGVVLTFAAPAAVTSGQVLLVNALLGVVQANAASGADMDLLTTGVVTCTKKTGEAWAIGAKIYWNDTNKEMTTLATGAVLAGVAASVQASGDTTGNVRLDGAAR